MSGLARGPERRPLEAKGSLLTAHCVWCVCWWTRGRRRSLVARREGTADGANAVSAVRRYFVIMSMSVIMDVTKVVNER